MPLAFDALPGLAGNALVLARGHHFVTATGPCMIIATWIPQFQAAPNGPNAKILRDKNDCFKPFLSGNGPQFEMVKFHEWLKANGELLTAPGLSRPKYKLNGGSLGEMVIEQRNRTGTKVYNLKLKQK